MTVVCAARNVPKKVPHQRSFTAYAVAGLVEFPRTGVLVDALAPLAEAGLDAFGIPVPESLARGDHHLPRVAHPQALELPLEPRHDLARPVEVDERLLTVVDHVAVRIDDGVVKRYHAVLHDFH